MATLKATKYQSFADLGGPAAVGEHVAGLRARFAAQGISGFVIPRADRHQNEYLPPDQERLLWATGFSGSAGLAIVLKDKAALFVDGRYTVQAAAQTDRSVFDCRAAGEKAAQDWLGENLRPGDRLGFDPWNHTYDFVQSLTELCASLGAEFVAVATNPIDDLWIDRPGPPNGPISARPLRLSGESSEAKLSRLRAAELGADALFISDAHNVAWLFNIRGADIAHIPLPLAFAYVPREGKPTLFVAATKLSAPVRERIEAIGEVREPSEIERFLVEEAKAQRKIAFDKATAAYKLIDAFREAGGKFTLAADPVTLMKACKNDVEIESARRAHLIDGTAVVQFLEWFDREGVNEARTEIDAAVQLEAFRSQAPTFRDISFPTISAAGPHAALPHYRVGEASDIPIAPGLFLIDSGAQYEEGTTDITRTIAVGEPSQEMIDRYTRVLKGHIAVATCTFPEGTSGAQIDAFARRALWDVGADFDHGTGHGVGVYLSVHEGPQRIAKTASVALRAGMIVSNEPGYYAPERFGVRIENLLVVVRKPIAGAEREMLGFETISLAPIDLRPVDRNLLNEVEIEWINAYHGRVREALAPHLEQTTLAWLEEATKPRWV
jgi:Xaa-Pro aminopeptidase